ncbi:MAG: response regulator [Chloroflexi bacterium]|nr:response regulator [Chloroflexota bacterium]
MVNSNNTLVRTVIAARPGLMRDSLQSLLRAIPHVQVVALTDALETVQALVNEQRVDFVVLDADLDETRVAELARQFKREHLRLLCLVLAATSEQEHALQAQGAEVVVKNYLDEKLIRTWLSTGSFSHRFAM